MVRKQVIRDTAAAAGPSGTVTLVVRLLARSLDRGQLVGQGEVVATGEVADLRGPDDLVRLAAQAARGGQPRGERRASRAA